MLTQRQPVASAPSPLGQLQQSLLPIGDEQERRVGKPHVPTRPNCGLDGSAWASFGMRPARRASRPASTAAHMLLAIITGSRAFDTAVLAAPPRSQAPSTPSQSTHHTPTPPHPPSPDPIGEPSGITAAAPESASLRQTIGSSVQ